MPTTPIRWRQAGEAAPGGQGALFADDELGGVLERVRGVGEFRGLEFLHVRARRILNEVPSAARLPFRWTVNAYRGCSHACTYCFARPTHAWLGLDTGADFDTKIVVKVNAVEALRAELRSPRWRGEHVAMGTNTDPYQRAEGRYRLTAGVVDVLADAANPFSILTKSTLVLRDLDRLVAAARRTTVRLNLSIGTLDEAVWKLTEPGTPHPRRRVEAVRRLTDAGLECGVLMGPVIPGLSDGDDQLREVVEACVAAGASSISAVALHLRPGVREHWMAWLGRARPDLVTGFERRYRRADLPRTERAALGMRVRELVDDARRRHRRARPVEVVDDDDVGVRLARQGIGAPPPSPAVEQLGLW